jgi:hypothetical protein
VVKPKKELFMKLEDEIEAAKGDVEEKAHF